MTSKTAINSNVGTDPNRSIRNASLTAGIALLLISALAGFGYFVAVKGLVTPGNATRPPKTSPNPKDCSGSASSACSW